ncbi:uncharacterized protein TRUGW13939_04390 [Talaromyces rugulosus]|uniref:Uncharacterized protein n=1 Tax=Talaromyces rugulosus TaxID=121627 RepID=A0A7H8QTK5_TALRU|nr:uncharacterized protein TRUGW13939_04390 [Talaromyces rugulosus]QKX57279.1 hypothetical protein TRUGW13939_04390 [Talaromyces rugulosus]
MDFLRRIFYPQQGKIDTELTMESSLVCPRENTVEELANILDCERVVHVRGTPASGKSMLAGLLVAYYRNRKIPVIYKNTWPQEFVPCYNKLFVHMFRENGYDFDIRDYLFTQDVAIILDEAQMSYGADDLWLGLIKSQSGNRYGPRIAIFTSYGSPTKGPEMDPMPGSPLAFLGPQQRVSITPSIVGFSPKIALFYNREEFDDVVFRYCHDVTSLLKLDDGASDYLFSLTNGHPGAVNGILNMLQNVYRSDLKRDMDAVREADIRKTLEDKNKAFAFLEQTPVQRSFVDLKNLNPHAANTLRKVLIEGSMPRDLDNEGVRICYERGWLHTEPLDVQANEIICVLPTKLHAKFVEYNLADPKVKFPREKYPDIEALAEATLRQFSRRNMRAVSRYGAGAIIRPLEATYQDEFYRSLHTVLGYAMDVTSEWSPDGVGRIDFRLGSVGWGIEVLREGDRLHEHCQRFTTRGTYGKWIQEGLLQDWLVIDCRATSPRPYEIPDTKLWRAVFAPDFSAVEVRNQYNQVVVDRFALTE